MRTSNLAIDLERITNQAFRTLNNAISKKELSLAQEAEELYHEVCINLKQGLGPDIRSKGVTGKTCEFDRYLLQYIIGNETARVLKNQLTQKTIQFLRPQSPEEFKDITLITRVIDHLSSNDRYPKIEKMAYELATHQRYGLLIEALQHIQRKYSELDKDKYKPTQVTPEQLRQESLWFSESFRKKD